RLGLDRQRRRPQELPLLRVVVHPLRLLAVEVTADAELDGGPLQRVAERGLAAGALLGLLALPPAILLCDPLAAQPGPAPAPPPPRPAGARSCPASPSRRARRRAGPESPARRRRAPPGPGCR